MSPEDLRELFSAFGPIDVRRMFGGAGIFADGVMFALVHAGVIYLRTDGVSAAAFDRENLPPFTYTARGVTRALSAYRRMPDRLYDDGDELAAWARSALAAARRAQAPTRQPRKRAASKRAVRR